MEHIMPSHRRVVLQMVASLSSAGSQTSRTHIQKSIYLASVFGILREQPYNFVLHLHGPYSFELDQEIMDLQAEHLLNVQPNPSGYGSKYKTDYASPNSKFSALTDWLGKKSVRELEAIATVAFVIQKSSLDVPADVHRIKPHLTMPEITHAHQEYLRKRSEFSI